MSFVKCNCVLFVWPSPFLDFPVIHFIFMSSCTFCHVSSTSETLGETILDGIEKLGAKMSETPLDRQAALLAKLDLSSSTVNYRPPVVIAGNMEPPYSSLAPEGSNSTPRSSVHKPGTF